MITPKFLFGLNEKKGSATPHSLTFKDFREYFYRSTLFEKKDIASPVFVDVNPLFRSPGSCATLIFLDLSFSGSISRLLLGDRFYKIAGIGTEYIRMVFA